MLFLDISHIALMFPFNWGKLVSMLVCIRTEIIGSLMQYWKLLITTNILLSCWNCACAVGVEWEKIKKRVKSCTIPQELFFSFSFFLSFMSSFYMFANPKFKNVHFNSIFLYKINSPTNHKMTWIIHRMHGCTWRLVCCSYSVHRWSFTWCFLRKSSRGWRNIQRIRYLCQQ